MVKSTYYIGRNNAAAMLDGPAVIPPHLRETVAA
jgi:hypothetical protein